MEGAASLTGLPLPYKGATAKDWKGCCGPDGEFPGDGTIRRAGSFVEGAGVRLWVGEGGRQRPDPGKRELSPSPGYQVDCASGVASSC